MPYKDLDNQFSKLLLKSALFVRASRYHIIKAIWTLKNSFIELNYEENAVKNKNYQIMKPTYIPMGYKQISHTTDGFLSNNYENSKKETITFDYIPISTKTFSWFSTKGYEIEDIMINQYIGKLFLSDDEDSGIMLVWNDGMTQYIISSSDTNKNEILRIARSYR